MNLYIMQPLLTSIRYRLLALAIVMTAAGAMSAQAPGPRGGDRFHGDSERVDAMRIAFLTKRLALTPEEASVFWPVYNAFDSERDVLLEGRGAPTIDVMSDEELEKTLLGEFQRQKDMASLQERYYSSFKDVLPRRKATMVFMLEHQFREEVMAAMRRRMEGGQSRSGGPGGDRPGTGRPGADRP